MSEICSGVAEVTAIETIGVPAGSFTAARVEETVDCTEDFKGRGVITTWIASEVGMVRMEVRVGGSIEESFELTSFEIP